MSTSGPFKLAYISPQFPIVGGVFEQNEVLGLIACGTAVDVLSCRRASELELKNCHRFCRPILSRVQYASSSRILGGMTWCLLRRPLVVARLMARAIHASVRQPRRVRQHLGSLLLAMAFAPFGRRAHWDGIHANWLQGTGTVAWYLSELLGPPFSMTGHAFDIYSGKPGDRETDGFFRGKAAAAAAVFVAHQFGLRRL